MSAMIAYALALATHYLWTGIIVVVCLFLVVLTFIALTGQ